jgi:hypothetical protein
MVRAYLSSALQPSFLYRFESLAVRVGAPERGVSKQSAKKAG